jgi:hypothetical protein
MTPPSGEIGVMSDLQNAPEIAYNFETLMDLFKTMLPLPNQISSDAYKM